jgi:hypothetical protein
MKTLTTILLLAAMAGAQTKVKGHALGETPDQFLAAFISRVPALTAASTTPTTFRMACKQGDKHKTFCAAVATVDATGSGTIEDKNDVSSYVFSNGKLVAVTVMVYTSFAGVMANLTDTYGPPAHSGTIEVQNGFGARFTCGHADWAMPDKIDITVTQTVLVDPVLGLVQPISVRFAPHVEVSPKANPFN